MRNDIAPNASLTEPPPPGNEVAQAILAAIKSIRYGSVEIIIQDAKVVQIERTEKIRFDKKAQ